MPLEDTGVRFVSEGFGEFIKNIGEASKTIASLGRMTENRLEALRQLNNILATGSEQFNKYAQSAQKMVDSNEAIGKSFDVVGQAGNIFNALLSRMGGSIAKYAGIGGMVGTAVGGLAGLLFPTVGEEVPLAMLGGLGGNLIGALVGVSVQVTQSIAKLFADIGNMIFKKLPGLIGKIAQAGLNIAKAFYDLGKKIIDTIGSIIKTITSAIGGFFNSILNLFTGGGGRGGWRSLGNTIVEAMFKFEILKQVIRKVIEEFKIFSKEAFNAATELQVLAIRLDNLIGAQIRAAKITDDWATSVKKASPYTQELLQWIQKLALATPISVDDISRMTYLGLAMGWTVKGAKDLTKAIVDYTATLGMGSEISERIIYNFAQMRQQGKVTGTELRDLGRGAFMPINTILEIMYKQMGETSLSFQEFRDQASSGAIDVKGFFDAFITYVGRDMPDAAYKLNYTFEATIQNLHDLFKILLGWNVFGPTIQAITKPLQTFINRFKEASTLAKANAIGKALAYIIDISREGAVAIGRAFDSLRRALGITSPTIDSIVKSLIKLGQLIYHIELRISTFIRSLFPFFEDIGERFNKTFSDMTDDFFSWGMKLIYSFAEGIVRGAAKFLTAAISFIGKLLTGWFKAGSPPKILPDIDKWGMETINEWLHGFTQADFDILDDIQGIIKDTLSALQGLGTISAEEASKQFVNLSVELMRSFDEFNRTGKITTDIFDRLRALGGAYGKEVSELLELQLQHIVALERATRAQKDYDAAVEKRLKTEIKVNQLVREYNNMLRKGFDKKLLKEKLKTINATEIQYHADARAEMIKKDELDIAKKQLAVIEEQVKLQESLIKQMTELAQAQKAALGGTAESLDELASALTDWGAGLGELIGGEPLIDFEQLKKDAEREFHELFTNLTKDWDNTWYDSFVDPNSPFQKAISGLVPTFTTIKNDLIGIWDEFAAAIHLPSWEEISAAWNVPDKWVTTAPTIKRGGQEFTWEEWYGEPQPPHPESATFVERIQSVINTFYTDIQQNGGIKDTLGKIGLFIFNTLKEKITEAFNNNKQVVADAIITALSDVGKLVGKGLKSAFLGAIGADMDASTGEIIWRLYLSFLKAFWRIATLPLVIGGNIIRGIFQGMWNYLTQEFPTDIKNFVDGLVDRIEKALGIESPAKTMLPIGKSIIEGIFNGFVAGITDLWSIITGGLADFVAKIEDYFGIGKATWEQSPLYIIGTQIIEGIKQGIISGYNALRDLLRAIGINLPEIVAEETETGSPSRVFQRLGRDWMLGLEKGVMLTSGRVERTMTDILGNSLAMPTMRRASAMQSLPVAGGTNVNFGDVYITNDMDWAMFKAQVQRAILED